MMMNDWEKIGMYQVQMRMNSNKHECARVFKTVEFQQKKNQLSLKFLIP